MPVGQEVTPTNFMRAFLSFCASLRKKADEAYVGGDELLVVENEGFLIVERDGLCDSYLHSCCSNFFDNLWITAAVSDESVNI